MIHIYSFKPLKAHPSDGLFLLLYNRTVITVAKKEDHPTLWVFDVSVEDPDSAKRNGQGVNTKKGRPEGDTLQYTVSLDKTYWSKLTEGRHTPESLVERSFQFLLDNEPKESILKNFNIKIINNYFPRFETEIRDYLI